MTRNLKLLGLTLVAALALSAVVALAASASPAKFTAAVGAGETAKGHGEQIGTNKFTIGSGGVELTCATAGGSGEALTKGPESTEATVTPTFSTCHAIVTILGAKVTRAATVTMNGCGFKFNATKNTNSPGGVLTPFSTDLTVECAGKPIEVHVYTTAAEPHNNTVLCTYDIGPQTVNNQIQLTNKATDVVAVVNATVALTNTVPNATCTTATSAIYEGEGTLTGTNEAGASVNSSVS